MDLDLARREMVTRLRAQGVIRSDRVFQAMLRVPRHLFVPPNYQELAYLDRPLEIGHGQTISAPHMVAIMVELLDLQPGHRVMEVGGGSGYHAAVMAELVRPDGRIFALELVPGLAERAQANLKRSRHDDVVQVMVRDGSLGLPEEAPFDRISVAASAPSIPAPLVEQLKEGGILLIPVGGPGYQELMMVRRHGKGTVSEEKGSVLFVPLLGAHGHR